MKDLVADGTGRKNYLEMDPQWEPEEVRRGIFRGLRDAAVISRAGMVSGQVED